ncbi:MAG: hypothetical protein HYR70_10945 [Chloroflexi bacterium]|nr:hypothetical protein [Chloroflexota bacterium]MBI3340055.1 hypothetical protein [Chloroflexota bacterium]
MNKTCFFIGPIGDEKTPTRDWSDQILKYIITPVTSEFKYENPVRSDSISRPGSITLEIMKHLVEDALVVADLTEGNPNVFYELAIRHLLQKPTIHVMKQGEKIPFDVYDFRVIPIRIDNVEAAEKAKNELRYQIRSIEADENIIIPYVLQVRQLKGIFDSPKSDAEKETLLNLLEQLENIYLSVGDVKSELVVLNNQLNNTRREGPPSSPFIEKRLAKAESIKEQRKKEKK